MQFDSLPWVLAEGEHEGQPLLIRFRQFPADFDRSLFHERLNIFWKMSESEDWGLPMPAETDRLEVFENRLVEAVESDSHSVLSVVLTCNGQREFVFHTADIGKFMQRLTDMPQEQRRYPIEMLRTTDAAWEYDASVTPDQDA